MPKKIFTEEERAAIIHEYTVNKISAAKLGAQYGCSNTTLLKNLKEWGISANSKKLDLTGQVFGELTICKPAPKRDDRYTRWVCKCSCGKEVEVRTDFLTNGHTTSCGHLKDAIFKPKELVGQKFGKLTVIRRSPPESQECQCDCGNFCIVKTYNLLNGNTQSCGCLKSKGELLLNTLLTELQIEYKTQFTFNDCVFESGKPAYFDYAIFNNNKLVVLIEYDGEQHDIGWQHKEQSLQEIRKRDDIKNKYCKENNIPLIRISYKDYNKITKDYLSNIINSFI